MGCVSIRTFRAVFVVDVEDPDGALVAHTLFGETHDLLVVLAERHTLHGGGELPCVEALARADLPKAHRVVRGARDEELRGACASYAFIGGPPKERITRMRMRMPGLKKDRREARTVDIDRPNGPLMPIIIRSEPLAIAREPSIDEFVLRAREQEVALAVKLNLRERALVS